MSPRLPRLLTLALALLAVAAAAACGGEDAAPLAECGPCGWRKTGVSSPGAESMTLVVKERHADGCVLHDPVNGHEMTIRCQPLSVMGAADWWPLVLQPDGSYRLGEEVQIWEWIDS